MLLDSDVIIDLLREHPPALEWFDLLPDNEILIVSGYVVLELIQGFNNRNDLEKVQKTIKHFVIFWLPPDECNKVLDLYSEYKLSHNIGLLDVLIGQTALYLNVALYTFNQKHYGIIPNLETIQPYTK
jgi:predicted nucleic acid-binding protein